MSRAAARKGFETFLDSTVTATREEFSVGRALRGIGLGPGGTVVDRLRRNTETLERRADEPELTRYRERALEQFDAVLEYAENDELIEAFEERTPTRRREALVDHVLERNRRAVRRSELEPGRPQPANDFCGTTSKT